MIFHFIGQELKLEIGELKVKVEILNTSAEETTGRYESCLRTIHKQEEVRMSSVYRLSQQRRIRNVY